RQAGRLTVPRLSATGHARSILGGMPFRRFAANISSVAAGGACAESIAAEIDLELMRIPICSSVGVTHHVTKSYRRRCGSGDPPWLYDRLKPITLKSGIRAGSSPITISMRTIAMRIGEDAWPINGRD